MQFIFSWNPEVKKHVDPGLGKIPEGGNFTAFNNHWKAEEDTIEKIAEYTCDGNGLCAWHMVNGRRVEKGTGCIQAGLIILDIDNQADRKDQNGNKVQQQELTVEEALELDLCRKYLSFAYYSPSTSETWPRFRLVFGLAKPILDKDFYQWFTRELIKQVPGGDRRATQVPNLFYGTGSKAGCICVTDKFIPADVIDAAYAEYITVPKVEAGESNLDEALKVDVDPSGVDLGRLVSKRVRSALDGNEVDDRSTEMAVAFKEIIGWANWLRTVGIPVTQAPLDTANQVFYSVYQYDPCLDGKFNRILNSIQDPESLLPAIGLAADDGTLAIWKRIKSTYPKIYKERCPEELQERIKQNKPSPKNSVFNIDFNLTPESTPVAVAEFEPEMTTPATPATPNQLIQLQNNGNGQFSDNDIANIITNNYGDRFIYDSKLDEFFAYDEDEGIWYLNDEQHTRRRIIKTLDTFVNAGVLQKYNSSLISSVFYILKGKLLRSVNGGRETIWKRSSGMIPFRNGALDAKTMEFHEGNQREMFFQTKLSFDYDRTKKCPNILKWLEWSVGKDKLILIRAFCRAVLTGYTTGERFLHLIGPGGSGKSTLQQLLIALSGYTGTHTSDLETIETNRFECHSLIGKRLLLLTDEASFSKRLDTLKKLTSSSDTLRAERKYGKEVINFKPEILVSIASNEHISSSDLSSGLERRRLTIVMDQVIDPSKRRNLISVFPDRIEGEFVEELSGFASWLLDMPYADMRDVLANPVKHVPTLNTSNIDALVFNNHICAFLSDCCLYAPNSSTTLGGGAFKPSIDESERGLYVKNAFSEVYASYVNYCKANSYKCNGKAKFIERLKETVNYVLKVPGISVTFVRGKAVVTGIRLKPYDITTDRAASGDNRLPSPIEWAADPTAWDAAFEEHDKPASK